MKPTTLPIRTLLCFLAAISISLTACVTETRQVGSSGPFGGGALDVAPPKLGVDSVAVFSGVSGTCFSTAGTRTGRFPQYPDHETTTKLTRREMKSLLGDLLATGFFEERSRRLPPHSLPPMSFRVLVVLGDDWHECIYYHRRGLTAPERLLRVFDRIPDHKKTPALRKFLKANREV